MDLDTCTPSTASPVAEKAEELTAVTREDDQTVEPELQYFTDTLPEGMSKTQWKKKLRLQEKRRKWEKKKQEAKQRKKEKQKQLKEEREALGIPAPKKAKLDHGATKQKSRVVGKGQYKKMSDKGASSVRVAVDCSFEHLMSGKEQLKLMKQIQRCYAANRRSVSPFQYYVTSYGGKMKAELDGRYPVTREHEQWDIHYESGHYIEVFGKENVVYLLAESPNVLTELDSNKAYIIGGLVDHNHHKGHCFELAQEKGLAHARLPLSEYIQLNSRKILTINHVYEILLAFSTNGGDWKKAFYHVIPPRKLCSGNASNTSSSQLEVEGQQSSLPSHSDLTSTDNKSIEDQQSTSQPPNQTLPHSREIDGVNESSSESSVSEETERACDLDKSYEDDIHSQLEPCISDF